MIAKLDINMIQIAGVYYTAVHGDGVTDCSKCALNNTDCMAQAEYPHCVGDDRKDGKPVYFIKNDFLNDNDD